MADFHFSPRRNRAHEIRWRAWGDAPFAEAKSTGKPVLLAISAVWCHWCHVMDETTYSDDDVISAINNRFIPVRVDNDQRPDINARYNQGGWPTTAILTPEGEVLKGATYVPPDQMQQLLAQIDSFFSDTANRLAVAKQVQAVRARRAAPRHTAPGGPLKPDVPDRIFSFLDAAFDEDFGGFGTDQKFPQTNVLHFLLDFHARRLDPRSREMVQRTLRAMSGGGMYDSVEGGFYRYSTTRDFSVPHFEKMLEDLGGLLLACARAAAMFEDAELGRVASDVKAYADAHLWNAAVGAYGGSQDADEAYYRLDAIGRASLAPPFVDPTVYASWNAEIACAIIVAGPLLESFGAAARAWTARGIGVLDALWSTMLVDGLMCRYFDGAPHVRGLLGDQAWCAWAALSAFEATGAAMWLERATALVVAADELYDDGAHAYVDRIPDQTDAGRLVDANIPFDENALMARVLCGLTARTAEPRWATRAEAILGAGSDVYRSYGSFASAFGSAALEWLDPPLDVKIVGRAEVPDTVALRDAALRRSLPAIRLDTIDPVTDSVRLTALGHVDSDKPTAYVCKGRTCFARVTEARDLDATLSHALTPESA